jgi:hypothetical protein
MLSDFDYFRPHFELLIKQMNTWKPERKGDLLQPGYTDRLTYFSTIFGIGIGILGLIGVISTIIGTIIAWLTYNKIIQQEN